MKKKINHEVKFFKTQILISFFVILLATLLLNIFIKDKDFSVEENRALKTFPQFKVSSIFDGSYQKNLESYFQDQFIMRNQFVKMKTWLDKLTLRQEINKTYINDKDFLISKFDINSKEVMDEKINSINKFLKANPALKPTFMFVPNKVEIYKDKLPAQNIEPSQSKWLDYMYENLDGRAKKINLIKIFNDNKSSELYFNNDHHWTQTAAYLAYQSYREALNIKDEPIAYDVKGLDDSFYGTLSAKTGLESSADTIKAYVPRTNIDYIVNIPSEKRKTTSVYDVSKLLGKDKYLLYFGGNYPVVRISTTSPNDKRLLVIKDSYANAFTPFLIQDYSEIIMVDLRYYQSNINQLVSDYNITDVLFLYNINTFNDDSSILNLTDYIDDKGNAILEDNTKKETMPEDKTKDNKDKTTKPTATQPKATQPQNQNTKPTQLTKPIP